MDTQKSKDPVCGMDVERSSRHHSRHDGKDYVFCSADCARAFKADPKRYTEQSRTSKTH
jgi:Cu+-exporting ATPase